MVGKRKKRLRAEVEAGQHYHGQLYVIPPQLFPSLMHYLTLGNSLWAQQHQLDGGDGTRWHADTVVLHGAEQRGSVFGGSNIQYLLLFHRSLLAATAVLWVSAVCRSR